MIFSIRRLVFLVIGVSILQLNIYSCKETESNAAKLTYESEVINDTLDSVVISKSDRQLRAFASGKIIVSYKISLGSEPNGTKRCEGDNRTPEGTYHISFKKDNSSYHKALQISYPDSNDIAASKSLGCDPGGFIMIHGIRNGLGWLGKWQSSTDWTKGCIAIENENMDELYAKANVGTIVSIHP